MGHYAARLEDGTRIEIRAETYQEQFHAYLERIGEPPKSWLSIMLRAEREWEQYCLVMDAFASNTQQWLDHQGREVFIDRASEE
jgi:hypothetical protein